MGRCSLIVRLEDYSRGWEMNICEHTHVVMCIEDGIASLCSNIVHSTLELREVCLVESTSKACFEGAHAFLCHLVSIPHYI